MRTDTTVHRDRTRRTTRRYGIHRGTPVQRTRTRAAVSRYRADQPRARRSATLCNPAPLCGAPSRRGGLHRWLQGRVHSARSSWRRAVGQRTSHRRAGNRTRRVSVAAGGSGDRFSSVHPTNPAVRGCRNAARSHVRRISGHRITGRGVRQSRLPARGFHPPAASARRDERGRLACIDGTGARAGRTRPRPARRARRPRR